MSALLRNKTSPPVKPLETSSKGKLHGDGLLQRDVAAGRAAFRERLGGFAAAPFTLSNQTWEFGTGVYGSGCSGTAGVPSLVAASALQLGQSWSVDVDNLNPTFNLAFVAIGLTKLPGVDLSVINMPGCFAYTNPDLLVSVTGTAGQASWSWPAVVGPIGAGLYAQALCLDPAANGFGFTTSNAVFATITN